MSKETSKERDNLPRQEQKQPQVKTEKIYSEDGTNTLSLSQPETSSISNNTVQQHESPRATRIKKEENIEVTSTSSQSPTNGKEDKVNSFDALDTDRLLDLIGLPAQYEIAVQKAKATNQLLPKLTFPPKEWAKVKKCNTIFTSNWPDWITPFLLKVAFKVTSDFCPSQHLVYIEMLQYNNGKDMGAAFLRFESPKDCFRIYCQIRQISLRTRIKIALDIDDLIAKSLNYTFGDCEEFKSGRWMQDSCGRYRYVITQIPPKPLMRCARKNKKNRNRPVFLSRLSRYLGINKKGLSGQRTQIEKRLEPNFPIPFNPEELDESTKNVSALVLKNLPEWFDEPDIMHILMLFAYFDFQIAAPKCLINILSYSNGQNMGIVYMKFLNHETALQVYKGLRQIPFLQRATQIDSNLIMQVEFDIDNKVAKMDPKWESEKDWERRDGPTAYCVRRITTTIPCPPDTAYPSPKTVPCPYLNKDLSDISDAESDEYDDSIEITNRKIATVDTENMNQDSNYSERTVVVKSEHDDDLHDLIKQELMDLDIDRMFSENEDENDNNDGKDELPSRNNNDNTKTTSKVVENNAKNQNVVESSDSEESCKVVHLKNIFIVPMKNKDYFFHLLKDNTPFNWHENSCFVKKLTGENSIGEYLLRFNSHREAAVVASALNGFRQENMPPIEAKLTTDYSDTKTDSERGKSLKRKLSKDTSGSDDPAAKKVKSCEDWQPINFTDTKFVNYGLNPHFLSKIKCGPVLRNNVIVSNLHNDVTESKLREIFSLAGEIRRIRLKCRETQPKTAKIEYDHPIEAVQAVSMFHKQKLYDQEMTVKIDESSDSDKELPSGLSGIGKGLGLHGEPIRGARILAELKPIHEILYEMDKMKKKKSKHTAFQARYTKRMNSASNTPSQFNVSTAIETFSLALVALEIIPPGSLCKDVVSLFEALKKNPAVKHHIETSQNQMTKPSPQITARPQRTRFAAVQEGSASCSICRRADHPAWRCPKFLQKSVNARRQIVKVRRLCFYCLGDHFVKDCPRPSQCGHCGGKHHLVLCLALIPVYRYAEIPVYR